MSNPLSILIVTWNSWSDLQRCLDSIFNADDVEEYEIVVIDNGSEDNTVTNTRERYGEKVNLHCNPTNLGLAAAVNLGMQLAQGDYVMLLDVDTEVQHDTATLLLQFVKNHPETPLIAPRIQVPEGHDEGTARNLPSVMSGLFGRQATMTKWFPGNRFSKRYLALDERSDSIPFRVEQVSAACMFFRRDFVEEVGPWDEAYRCYWVDTDWCARLKRMEKPIYCVPQARVTHYENNRAGKKKSTWRIWHFHTGAFRLYRKHYTLGWLDPRALIAGMLLISRAGVMLVLNQFQST